MKAPSRGILAMFGSATAFSLMAVCVKLGSAEIPPQELIAVRSLFIIAAVLPILRRRSIPFFGNNRKLLLLRGFLGYVAMSCYFYTLGALPVADAMVLQYLSPIFTILWAALFLAERPRGPVVPAAVICLVGLLLVVNPQGGGSLFVGAIGLVGAALAGGAYAAVRALRTTDNPYTIVLYFPLVSLPPSLLLALSEGWVWPASGSGWWGILGVCIFSYLGQIFLTLGLRSEAAPRAILVNYVSVGLGLAFGLLLFDTVPTVLSIVGAGLILAGISLVALHKEKSTRAPGADEKRKIDR